MKPIATKNSANHHCDLTTGNVAHEGGDPLQGSKDCLANNSPILRKGDQLQCKAPKMPKIISGSSVVVVNNKPAAFTSCKTDHNSVLLGGESKVIIGR